MLYVDEILFGSLVGIWFILLDFDLFWVEKVNRIRGVGKEVLKVLGVKGSCEIIFLRGSIFIFILRKKNKYRFISYILFYCDELLFGF